MILDLKIDVKHTGPTAIVVFTSNLNEAADNVIVDINNNRNHGPSEISKF